MKKSISIFFLILFTAFLAAPALITAVDPSVDISYFYSVSEEENQDSNKLGDEKLTHLLKENLIETFLEVTDERGSHIFESSLWDAIYFDTLSPPPDHILIYA